MTQSENSFSVGKQSQTFEQKPKHYPFDAKGHIPQPYKDALEDAAKDDLAKRGFLGCGYVIEITLKAMWNLMGDSIMEFNNAINWGTTDPERAQWLDQMYEVDMRREDAERKLDELRQSILRVVMDSMPDQGTPE